ncbi:MULTISPECIES: hypothetical protein [Gammaproteobacteria]|uniref:hypothetical protein n=1 Tax=Gammaproteobacteria TaxID=1236 RepID=UPI003A921C15
MSSVSLYCPVNEGIEMMFDLCRHPFSLHLGGRVFATCRIDEDDEVHGLEHLQIENYNDAEVIGEVESCK